MQEVELSEVCLKKNQTLEIAAEYNWHETVLTAVKNRKKKKQSNNFFKNNAKTIFTTAAIIAGVCSQDGENIAKVVFTGLAGAVGAGTFNLLASFGEWEIVEKKILTYGFAAGVICGVCAYPKLQECFQNKIEITSTKKEVIRPSEAKAGYYQSHLNTGMK